MRVLLLVALSFILLVLADPGDQSTRSDGLVIPLFKRSEVCSADGLVQVHYLKASMQRSAMKFKNALEIYENNTGSKYPVSKQPGAGGTSTSDFKGNSPEQHLLALDLHQGLCPKGPPAKGIETLAPYGSSLWYGLIGVGDLPRAFSVDFDTGSSDLFLPSISCDSSCDGHARYDPSLSNTSVGLNKTFLLRFADNSSVTGEQFNETVVIAGLTAKNQTIGSALTYSAGLNYTNFPADGLAGLGFQQISAFNTTPLFQNLVAQGQVSEPLFSVKLAKSGAEICLGCINNKLYKGLITYFPLTVEGFWQYDIDSVAFVGDSKVQLSHTGAVVDTGTTGIVGTEKDVNAIYAQIPGSQPADPKYALGNGTYTIPCDFNTSLSFVFGRQKFSVAPDFFNLGPIDPNDPSVCFGSLMYSPFLQSHNITLWILGDSFIQNYYVVFDAGKKRIGFADLVKDD